MNKCLNISYTQVLKSKKHYNIFIQYTECTYHQIDLVDFLSFYWEFKFEVRKRLMAITCVSFTKPM